MRNSLLIIAIFFSFVLRIQANETVGIPGEMKEPAVPVRPLTLLDCYKLALKQSEIIAIDVQVIKESEARFLQALGTLLPQVSFVSTTTWSGYPAAVSSLPTRTSERKFVFTQALFSGFKEFAAMTGSKAEQKQRINEKKRAEQLLLVDLADAFYLLMEEREDLQALQTIRTALIERIKELKKRVELGRSRRSEVVNTEAQLYSVYAQIETARSQEAIVRQLLEFLVGRPVDVIIDSATNASNLNPQAYYVARAAMRSDVEAAQQAWEVSKKNVTLAKSNFFPTVSLENNYYEKRARSSLDPNWDAQLTVSVPIFEGTTTLGAVKESRAKAREDELSFKRAGRSAIQDIRDTYVNVKAGISKTEALKKALDAAELNYALQRQDYQFNLVNNLDVLAAIQTLQDARRKYIQSFYESRRFYWQLRVAVEEVSTEKLDDTF